MGVGEFEGVGCAGCLGQLGCEWGGDGVLGAACVSRVL